VFLRVDSGVMDLSGYPGYPRLLSATHETPLLISPSSSEDEHAPVDGSDRGVITLSFYITS